MIQIDISRSKCTGCGICLQVCPRGVLAQDQAQWTGSFHPIAVIRPARCTVCRNCEALCPTAAITVTVR